MNEKIETILNEVGKVIRGKDEAIELVMTAILAKGHILIEDVPGVGKTTLAVAFSRAMELTERRLQFTPDVLPSDVVGFNMIGADGEFQYKPGAILCNLLLADEINRTSTKTQSALLEVMEEGHVTVDGITRDVPKPFMVIATQNPVGSAGTQMLPESQLDRFMICLSMGYPNVENEIAILKGRDSGNPISDILPIIRGEELLLMQKETEQVFIHDRIFTYMAELAAATRTHPMLELGLSPRGTLALAKMSKAAAFLNGRNYVTPADVVFIFKDVALHRIRLSSKARVSRVTADAVADSVLEQVDRPTPKRL